MTKRTILVIGSMLLLVGSVGLWQRARHASDTAQAPSGSEHVQPAGEAAAVLQQTTALPVATQAAPGQPTREEEPVLAMYDGMADALIQHRDDCDAMGLAVEELVTTYGAQVARLMAARAQLSAASQAAAQQRLESVAGERMGRVREGLRTGLSTCSEDERLLAALRKLAELNTPG